MTFSPSFDALPSTLPVFPLAQALVLPHVALPLDICEPRYLAMVSDVLSEPCRLIGMIQPQPSSENSDALYGVGCAGRISAFEETEDGRYILTLTGVSRFRTVEELACIRGYRRFQIDWSQYREDLAAPVADFDVSSVKAALRRYADENQLSLSWESIDPLDAVTLADALAQSLPLEVEHKQILLEAANPKERAQLLTMLLGGGGPGQVTAMH
jgi:Lon protease-like protein